MNAASDVGGPVAPPQVAIIVPARNEERFLRPCLRSIREQWFNSWECVIVDDGSTDSTAAIAEEFVAKDERFRLIRHEVGLGLGAARNRGVAATGAPYLTFLDADDFLYQHSLRRRLESMLEVSTDTVAGVYCDWQPTRENEGRTPPTREPANRAELVGFIHGPECPFIATAPLLRRDVFTAHDGFDESLPTAEDFDLWVRVMRNGYSFQYVPHVGVAYRQKASGMVFTGTASHARVASQIIEGQFEDRSSDQTPPLLSRSIATYLSDGAVATRLLGSFAIASAVEDDAGRAEIQRLLPASLPLLVRAGLDVPGALRAGLARASRVVKWLNDPEIRQSTVERLLRDLDLPIN